jgi:hypothetical protein
MNTAYPSVFSSVRNIAFVQNSSIQVNGRSTVTLGIKPSMLEAEGSSTLLLMRIEFPFERNTSYLSGFSNVGNITFVQNRSISSEWKKYGISWKKTIDFRSRRI